MESIEIKIIRGEIKILEKRLVKYEAELRLKKSALSPTEANNLEYKLLGRIRNELCLLYSKINSLTPIISIIYESKMNDDDYYNHLK
jgi:hypothetical protein